MTDPATKAPDPEFVLRIRPEPSKIPAEIRMRRALKILLRACDLRCMNITTATPTPPEPEESR